MPAVLSTTSMHFDEARAVTLGAVRSQMRRLGIDVIGASVDDAYTVLDDICRQDRSTIAGDYYTMALVSDNQMRLFARDWRRWQREHAR
jgi:hypothetical protein